MLNNKHESKNDFKKIQNELFAKYEDDEKIKNIMISDMFNDDGVLSLDRRLDSGNTIYKYNLYCKSWTKALLSLYNIEKNESDFTIGSFNLEAFISRFIKSKKITTLQEIEKLISSKGFQLDTDQIRSSLDKLLNKNIIMREDSEFIYN